jgi:hypothetical protein
MSGGSVPRSANGAEVLHLAYRADGGMAAVGPALACDAGPAGGRLEGAGHAADLTPASLGPTVVIPLDNATCEAGHGRVAPVFERRGPSRDRRTLTMTSQVAQ